MSDIFLPEELCYDILLRVPAVTLLRFKSVCKAWCRIIDNNGFAKTHFHHHEGIDGLIIMPTSSTKLYMSFIDYHKKSIALTNVKNLVGFGVGKIPCLSLVQVPSCNGIILIKDGTWTLWNLFTNESIDLPPHNDLPGWLNCGFGYDSATDDFKVVKTVYSWGKENSRGVRQTFLYSLKSNSWKNIPNFQKPVHNDGVFVNGALHWIIGSGCIFAFDLSTEKGRVLPPCLVPNLFQRFTLQELGGCMCLRDDAAVWVMKDYGVNVWTRLVSSKQFPLNGVVPVAYSKSKGQLLLHQQINNVTKLLKFDIENKCAKKVSIRGFYDDFFTCQVIPLSLLRLNRGEVSSTTSKGMCRKRQKITS